MYRIICIFLFFLIFSNPLIADDWNGVDYAQNSSVQLSHAARLLNSLSLKGDEGILDIGCGDGKITALLAKKVTHGFVLGIDPSDSMLSKAEITRQENDLFNLTFQKGAAENFSLVQRFDHIIAIHVMHWVKDQEKALENIHTHLKPNGHIHLILSPSKEGLPFYLALQKTLPNWALDFADFINPQYAFDMETYRTLMVKADFQIEAIHYLFHESKHENKERLTAWIKQWQPHAKHLPIHKQTDFLNELINNYLLEIGLHPETLESIKWGEYVLIVQAKKAN
ncbi:MAG: methyltransferase domain-containing protein [Parachlamydiaceae bacterium]|nr:methyltransferase domain-containing protein [Parachlamydiaceae bacterium]